MTSRVAFVIVSGPPGSGKSTLARALAPRLGLPLFMKDVIKESLMDSLGAPDVDASRRLGGASVQMLLALARDNGRGVLESNWRASQSVEDLRGLGDSIVEVFCDCDPAICRERYASRSGSRHPGHFDDARVDDDSLWSGEAAGPVNGGWPVVRVNTGAPVDLDGLCERISAFALVDDEIFLRSLTLADVDEWLAGEDVEQIKWFEFARPSTRDDVARAIEGWAESRRTAGPVHQWAICDVDTGSIAGGVEVRALSDGDAKLVNLSYVVFPRWRRRGFATRAARLALGYATRELDATAVEIKVLDGNVASLAVARHLGAHEVGTRPSDAGGTFVVFRRALTD